jgi:hypothetical protein
VKLALNFGAQDVLAQSILLRESLKPEAMTELLTAIAAWKIKN